MTEPLKKKSEQHFLLTEGCVCCGIGVPEGRMVCRACEIGARLSHRQEKRKKRTK